MTAVPVVADREMRPAWCGECDERTRQLELDDGRAARCPSCHPLTVERWLPVVGWEGYYEVSDLGRVRSLPRRNAPGGIMSPSRTRNGRYLVVKLARDGGYVTRRVHRLVGEAFLGPLPPGQHTRHGPGGSLDNRLVNLSYGTPLQNTHDQIRDGTMRRGTAKQEAKLTEAIVAECRARYTAGETQQALAAEFGVSQTTMGKAITGRTWTAVPAAPVPKSVTGRWINRGRLISHKHNLDHHETRETP